MPSLHDLGDSLDGLRFQIVKLTDGCKGLRSDLENVRKELDGVPQEVVDHLLGIAFGVHAGPALAAAQRQARPRPSDPRLTTSAMSALAEAAKRTR